MDIDVRTKLNLRVFEKLPGLIEQHAHDAVVTTAERIARDAEELAPKDTTALSKSIYLVTADGSTYSVHLAAAQAAFSVRGVFIPVAEIAAVKERTVAYVAVLVPWGIFQEYGTSRAPAQPFMTPAANQNRNFYRGQMRLALNRSLREAA